MFNINAYCFCPDFIEDVLNDIEFFHEKLIPSTVSSKHHLLLDKNEELWLAYLERLEGNPSAYLLFTQWETLLKRKTNKFLLSNKEIEGKIEPKDIVDVAISTPATAHRFIVTDDNNSFVNDINRLNENGVRLLHQGIFQDSAQHQHTQRDYTHSQFYDDVIRALSLVAMSRASRLENEHNDHLRDLLSMCHYNVYDQTRAGESSTRLSIGNLDLAIKHNHNWVTILEPLRLSSVDTEKIVLHYNKLIDNYNPLGIEHTHLIIYYTGRNENFASFFIRYKNKIQTLDTTQFDGEVSFGELVEKDTIYANIKSFIQSGTINGNRFQCFHTCISFV
ncbi:hypothetical protein AB3A94_000911 [Vibrio alginolyticus]|uniref:hypothetical protein n=1 Tax=Vibrio parahaemolyticus TaxID=670 RepID=UPI001123AB4D|nr:hypothetical protein [Vibrio parahaemolyticus]TOG30852.1 hypothetical protein CGJ04_09190 [Vibrio parahaemolyticus]